MRYHTGVEPRIMLFQTRRAAKLSQRALAARAGVPQSTVARIEGGLIDPRASTLNRLLATCGFELSLQRASIDERGIDRTLIRAQLQLTPRERLEAAAAAADGVDRLRAGRRNA